MATQTSSYLHTSTPYTKCPEALSLEPLKRDIRKTTLSTLKNDINAGLAVALLSIPQAIAYSIAIGVPPIAGILSTIFGTIVASLCSSSRHLIIGPNNATVMLVQTAACEIFATMYASKMSPEHREIVTLELMTILTMLIAFIQLAASVFKLSRILQFVSHSVIVGYVAGSAVAIAIDQLFIATQLQCPDTVETLFQRMLYWTQHIKDFHMGSLFVALISIGLLGFFKKKNPIKIIPPSLLMLIVTAGTITLFGLAKIEDASGKKLVLAGGDAGSFVFWGNTNQKLESEIFPSQDIIFQEKALDELKPLSLDFTLLNALIPVAFAIAFIGMLETNSTSKSIAVKSGERLTSSQDIFALGASNLCISLLSALPCSGSISRTATNYDSGAKTRFAGIFSGIFVAIIVAFLWPFIPFLPQASLAAILLATAPKMIDKNQIMLCLRATKSDALVIFATFFSCIFFSLHIAFYIGVMLSIVLYLRKAATPKVIEYQYCEETHEMRPITEEEHKKPHLIRIINVEGELFFGAVDLFQYALRAMSEDDKTTKVLILRLKHVRDLDATAALALKQLKQFLDEKGRKLIVSSVPYYVVRLLENAKLVELLGRENIIVFDENSPKSTTQRAIERAKELLQTEEILVESFHQNSEE